MIRRGNLSTPLSLERERIIIMRTHRVGAMPQQPKGGPLQDQLLRGVVGVSGLVNRPRVHSGMSLEVSGRSQAFCCVLSSFYR